MNILEIAGFITGVAGVWLTIRQNIWCFPVGLLNVILSLFLFLDQRLYSDVIQQGFYIVLLSYGWYNWQSAKTKIVLKVTELNLHSCLFLLVLMVLIATGMGYFFKNYSDADVPYLDASATAMSFVAQYLIAKKKIENWILWMVVNCMYIGIYLYKDLYLYSILFFVYLILAIYGWKSWKNSLLENSTN